ncbi:MAG TPA: hypothetical protein VIY48_01225, partial [Candidatus Paceibacterota bacterium]
QVQYGEMAKDAGVIKGFIEDYVPRIASKMVLPESEVQKILADIVPERTNVSGSTKTKFSKSRTQDTFDDFLRAAKEKGLDVSNVDFADVMGNGIQVTLACTTQPSRSLAVLPSRAMLILSSRRLRSIRLGAELPAGQ